MSANSVGKWVIPIAEMVAGYYTGNYGMMADGASKGYSASKSGKDDNGGSMKGQFGDIKSNPVKYGQMAYGSYANSGGGEAGAAGGRADNSSTDYSALLSGGDAYGVGTSSDGGTMMSDGSVVPAGAGGGYGGSIPDSGGIANSAGGSGDMGIGDIISGATSIIGGAGGIFNKSKSDKRKKKADEKWDKEDEDTQNRREATYRQDRALLLDGLKQYYEKRGMKFPDLTTDAAPGAGTSKGLPGEAPLYPENTAKAEADQYYGKPLIYGNNPDAPTDGTVMPTDAKSDTAIQRQQDETSGYARPVVKNQGAQQAAANSYNNLLFRNL